MDLFGCVISGCLDCVEQIRGYIRMRHFGFFGFSLGCMGCVKQIRGSIRMGYFGLFGFSLTNSLIYSDALFWVVWVEFNKFVDLFVCVILSCLGCFEQICGSI